MNVSLRQLRVFQAVALHSNFTAKGYVRTTAKGQDAEGWKQNKWPRWFILQGCDNGRYRVFQKKVFILIFGEGIIVKKSYYIATHFLIWI